MVRPSIILFYPATVPEKHPRFSMPYALLYLERMIRHLNIDVIIIDEDMTPDYKSEIVNHAESLFCVGVSSMTGYQLKGGINFSDYIRKQFPKVKIIWGGWHPSVLTEETLHNNYIDFIVHGQGEWAFKELIEALLKGSDVSEIKGLAYKKDSKTYINPRALYKNTQELPFVNYNLIDVRKYVVANTIVYFASHGCVYECGFCAMSTMYKKKWYPKSIDNIIVELKYLQRLSQFKYINFQDDNFFVSKPFTIGLCNAILASGLQFEFVSSAHACNLLLYTDEELSLIYKAGCRKVYIGAESGSQDVLDLINKRETVADNFKVLNKLMKHKIITVFSTMVALPACPEIDLNLTLDMIRKGKLIDERLEILTFYYTPYPETSLYKIALLHGFDAPKTTEEWSGYTMFNSKLPWHKKYFKKKLEYFYNYYFPFYNKSIIESTPFELKKITKLFIFLFFNLNKWRFRYNNFGFPFEAKIMLYFVRRYNRKYKQRFCFSGTWSFYENRYF